MTGWIRSISALIFLAMVHGAQAQSTLANVNPVAVDFGAVKMGATVTVPVTIQNISAATLGIASTGINDTNFFTIDGATCAQGNYQLSPGASCYFIFSFTPPDNAGTPYSTQTAFLIQNGSTNQVASLRLSGSGNETLAQVSPASIDFGDTFGQVTVPVTFLNTHAYPITFAGGGINSPSSFSSDSGTCGASLASGATCHFNYTFTSAGANGPVGEAQTSTGVSVSASSPFPMTQFVPIALKGNGVGTLSSPNVALWPVKFDFGLTKVGHANAVVVNYKNNSSGPITQSGGGFNDDQNGVFEAFGPVGTNCDVQSVPSGLTCGIQYVFTPREAKAYSAATGVTLSDTHNTLFYSINVNGSGVGTLARVSPATVDLGSVAFETFASVPVVITNTSDAPLINFTGGQATFPFSTTSNCGASLAVGASCAYTYQFYAPSAQSSLKAKYTVTTLLTLTNNTGIQPIVPIKISASVGDRLFGDGFDNT